MFTIRGSLHLNTGALLKISAVLILQNSHRGRGVLHLHTSVGHGPTHPPTSQKAGEEDSHGSILKTIHQMADHSGMLVLFSPLPQTVPFRSQTAWVTALNHIVKTTGGMLLT